MLAPPGSPKRSRVRDVSAPPSNEADVFEAEALPIEIVAEATIVNRGNNFIWLTTRNLINEQATRMKRENANEKC